METDEDHATMRESFLLVQNILFIEYTDAFPAHVQENMVEKLWKADAIWFGFLIAYFGGNLWCPCDNENNEDRQQFYRTMQLVK